MNEAIRVRVPRSAIRARRLLGTLTLLGSAALLLAASPAGAAGTVKDVRVGKHPSFTRIVFELDRPSGYQIERHEPAPGISELVVKIEASGSSGALDVPKSLIEAVRLQSDGSRTTAHIRLSRDGLRHKEMTLREPARIVIDVMGDQATVTSKPAASKPKVIAKPKAEPRATQPKTQAKVAPKPAPRAEPKPAPRAKAPVAEPRIEAAVKATAESLPEIAPASEPEIEPDPEPAKPAPSDDTSDAGDNEDAAMLAAADPSASGPSDPTAPSADDEVAVPAPPSGARSSLPAAASVPDSSDGMFNTRNLALLGAGVVVLALGTYVIARRRRDPDEYEEYADDDGDFGADNPFAGLASAGAGSDGEEEGGVAQAHEPRSMASMVSDASDEQTDLFADTPAVVAPADSGPGTTSPAGEKKATEGSEMSMDGTVGFGADPGAATTLAGAPGAGTDLEGVMRMVRELATRVGDLETRLEDAVDAKERLERQVAAQTEELRVQRAAIARTQRAVRNMSQSVEDTPTEPAPKAPTAGE